MQLRLGAEGREEQRAPSDLVTKANSDSSRGGGFGSSRSAPMPRGDWQRGADAPGMGVQAGSAEWPELGTRLRSCRTDGRMDRRLSPAIAHIS